MEDKKETHNSGQQLEKDISTLCGMDDQESGKEGCSGSGSSPDSSKE